MIIIHWHIIINSTLSFYARCMQCVKIYYSNAHTPYRLSYMYTHYKHICKSGTLFVFFWVACICQPFLQFTAQHTFTTSIQRTSSKTKKKLLCGFYEIFRTRLPAYFPVLILIQWCEWCAFYASFPNGCPHLTGSNFFYKYFLSYELWLLWLRRK